MAAMARAPGGGGFNGVMIALIVFVCLTVASLTVTVIMYTHETDLQTAKEDADKRATSANGAMNKTKQEVKEIAQTVIGEGTDEPERIKQTIATAMQPVLNDERVKKANIAADSVLLSALQGLYKLFVSNGELLAKATSERDELVKKLADLNAEGIKQTKKFRDKTEQLDTDYKKLDDRSTGNQTAWAQQIDELKKKLEGASASVNQQIAAERQLRQKIEKQLEEKETRVKELTEKLSKFSPHTDAVTSAQSADGTIVRAVAGQNIVYIGLGAKDRVAPGVPFSVYSAIRGIGEKEKATVEVITVFDTTSECRVTNTTPGDPILEGDLIANLVYDRSRQFNFVVAGDFDLDFDGRMDDPGGETVTRMIEGWGGKVVRTVDTSVDFVVLGAPPPMPVKSGPTDTDEAKQRAAERDEIYKAFDAIKSEAKALSLPILTRSQFLHFVGKGVPAKAVEDRPAL